MDVALRNRWLMSDQDRRISEAIARDEPRLRNFIRRRVADPGEAEDILQDVFYELVEAYRLMKPVEQVTAWLFRVARNRIIDLFRRKKREALRITQDVFSEDGERQLFEDLLPSPDAGPDAIYAGNILLQELEEVLDQLPAEQRDIFIAHEVMGYTFNELAEQYGVGVNTLLSRKHYAVKFLREGLREIYNEFKER
jgi:RNA polymerase sigma factor (sigma-70 family)